jgi:hypothetical protein
MPSSSRLHRDLTGQGNPSGSVRPSVWAICQELGDRRGQAEPACTWPDPASARPPGRGARALASRPDHPRGAAGRRRRPDLAPYSLRVPLAGLPCRGISAERQRLGPGLPARHQADNAEVTAPGRVAVKAKNRSAKGRRRRGSTALPGPGSGEVPVSTASARSPTSSSRPSAKSMRFRFAQRRSTRRSAPTRRSATATGPGGIALTR